MFIGIAVPSSLGSSFGAQSLSSASAIVPLPDFAPNGAISLGVHRGYKRLAPLERKRIQLLHLNLFSLRRNDIAKIYQQVS